MKNCLNDLYVKALVKKTIAEEKLRERTGSWFTEDFARIAIVVALGLIIIAAMVAIIGNDSSSGLLATLKSKIESIFSYNAGS